MPTTSKYFASSQRNPQQRAQFARQIMLAEFGQRYGRAIYQDNFVDRLPHEKPPRIHEAGGK